MGGGTRDRTGVVKETTERKAQVTTAGFAQEAMVGRNNRKRRQEKRAVSDGRPQMGGDGRTETGGYERQGKRK